LARRRWGFNPLVAALLWVGAEFLLVKAGFMRGLVAPLDHGSGLAYKIGILFGFLAISFIVVLINAIIACAIDKFVNAAKARELVYPESKRRWNPLLIPGLAAENLYLSPAPRAPPRMRSE
jgi:apolipoprotein N-acyltransferase